MREEEYWAEQSRHVSPITERCIVCGVVAAGQGPDGEYYCEYHMKEVFGAVYGILA